MSSPFLERNETRRLTGRLARRIRIDSGIASGAGFKAVGALCLCLVLSSVAAPPAASAAEVLVAVATNFAVVLDKLEPDFESRTGHDLRALSASTGKLYAQILHGAPYHVLVAGDRHRPARLVEAGRADARSWRTYAIGQLALWSADPGRVAPDGGATLRRMDFRRLAIANPDLAPYGAAALETLRALGLEEELRGRLVRGEDIGQAYALVASGNAELGFISASQLHITPDEKKGSHWLVPVDLYTPIRQDVVLLAAGETNPAATAFLDYLASDSARDVIRSFGYAVE